LSDHIYHEGNMKIEPDPSHGQSINAYGPGWVEVRGERFSASVIISPTGDRIAWNCQQFDDLQAIHFEQVMELKPELVLFGSGDRLRFPRPEWLQTLYACRIGLETMDTQAACRAYNFLLGEGRRVVAALLL
jgi:uncharacterized protein